MAKEFEAYGRNGERQTVEQCFWACIDEAQTEWKFQQDHPDEPKGMAEGPRHAYRRQRLVMCLSNILGVAAQMTRPQ